jgi:DNA-directed RNA polymerase specialized sigma24 family protein
VKLSKPQLDALLAALGPDTDQVGARYVKLREKLADFFLWNRSERPQEDADEAMDRLAKRIAEGEPIVNLASYAQKIARLVLLESNARSRREANVTQFSVMPAPDRSQEDGGEKTFDCLEPCLQKLPAESRALIVEYYSGKGGALIEARRQMAQRLGISTNTLRNRALRLRRELEECIARCAEKAGCAEGAQ